MSFVTRRSTRASLSPPRIRDMRCREFGVVCDYSVSSCRVIGRLVSLVGGTCTCCLRRGGRYHVRYKSREETALSSLSSRGHSRHHVDHHDRHSSRRVRVPSSL